MSDLTPAREAEIRRDAAIDIEEGMDRGHAEVRLQELRFERKWLLAA